MTVAELIRSLRNHDDKDTVAVSTRGPQGTYVLYVFPHQGVGVTGIAIEGFYTEEKL